MSARGCSACVRGAQMAAVQLAFRVPPPEIDACHAELVAGGVEMLGPPRDIAAWRHRALFFRDPEGNVIEIYAEV
jgi:lactoylglutathione lyase